MSFAPPPAHLGATTMRAMISVMSLSELCDKLDQHIYRRLHTLIRRVRTTFYSNGNTGWTAHPFTETSTLLAELHTELRNQPVIDDWYFAHQQLQNFDNATQNRAQWTNAAVRAALDEYLNAEILDNFFTDFFRRADDERRNGFINDEDSWHDIRVKAERDINTGIARIVKNQMVVQEGAPTEFEENYAKIIDVPFIGLTQRAVFRLASHARKPFNAFGRQQAIISFHKSIAGFFYNSNYFVFGGHYGEMSPVHGLNDVLTGPASAGVGDVSTEVDVVEDTVCVLCHGATEHRHWRQLKECGHIFGRSCLAAQLGCGTNARYKCAVCRANFF